MNYSENMKRRERRNRINRRFRQMFVVALLMGLVIGFVIGRLTVTAKSVDDMPPTTTPTATVESTVSIPTIPPTTEPMGPEETDPVSLGWYRITAYCACEKCCGEWAKNRPGGIVYGAAGIELKAGVSCASTLPFGTVVEVEGLGEYIVQDRMASWVIDQFGENLIDIYFDDHESACNFGLQYRNVYLKEEPQ